MSTPVEVHNPELDAEPGKLVRQPEAAPMPVALDASRTPSIIELIHFAIAQKTPVEQLEKLVDLQERVETRQARQAYFDALAAFQAECPQIKKSKTAKIAPKGGNGYSFTYAPLEEIDETIAPYLHKHDLSRKWNTDAAAKPGAVVVTCKISHVLGHFEESSVTLPVETSAGMSDQQKVSAAVHFGQRLSLTLALGLVTSDSPAPARDLDPEPIIDEQVKMLSDLVVETGADLSKFLGFMEVEALREIPATRFAEAVGTLKEIGAERKRREAAARAKGGAQS